MMPCLLVAVGCAFGFVDAKKDLPPPRFLLAFGSEGTKPGEFHFPIGIALTPAGEVLVTDHYNDRVQQFSPEGKLLAAMPVLPHPGGIAVDKDGNFFVSHFPAARLSKEKTPDRVTVYSPAGKFLREFGKSGKGDGEFDWPGGVAITRKGEVVVADQTNRRVQVFDHSGKFLRKWGEYGVKPGQFGGNVSAPSRVGGPNFVAEDSAGNLYTTEASVCRIQKFTPEGKFLLAWGDAEDKFGSFGRTFSGFKTNLKGPVGICVGKDDRVWVAAAGGRVQEFTSDGKFLRGFGDKQGTDPGQFYAPHGIAIDSQGHLYVVDAYNHRVQKFATAK
jgi:DNA-binding beta-propeller fold protein YncE